MRLAAAVSVSGRGRRHKQARRRQAMKPSRKALVALSLAIRVCAASIKALYHHHFPIVFSSFDSFTWRAEQLLSYSWIRITNPPKYGTLRWEVQQAKLKGA